MSLIVIYRELPPDGPSPYHEGYLDAEASNAYCLGDKVFNVPARRYEVEDERCAPWAWGVVDHIQDRGLSVRNFRGHWSKKLNLI